MTNSMRNKGAWLTENPSLTVYPVGQGGMSFAKIPEHVV